MDSVELLVKAYGAEFDGFLDATTRKIEETRARRAQLDTRFAGARQRGLEKGTARTRQLRRHLAAVRAQRRVAEDRNAQLLKKVNQLLVRISDDRNFQELQVEKLVYLKRRYWAFVTQVHPSWRKQCESKERQEVARLEQELENLSQQAAEENPATATRMALRDMIFRKKRELKAKRSQIAADTARLPAQYDEEVGFCSQEPEARREEQKSPAIHEPSASMARQSPAVSGSLLSRRPRPSRSSNTPLPQILVSSSSTSSSQGSLSPKSSAGVPQIDVIKNWNTEKIAGKSRPEAVLDRTSAGKPAPVLIKSFHLSTTQDSDDERHDVVTGRDERAQGDDQADGGDGTANKSRDNSPKSSSAAPKRHCEPLLRRLPSEEERQEIKGKDAAQGEEEESKSLPPLLIDSVSSLDISALSLSDTQDTSARAVSNIVQKQEATVGLRPLATEPRKMSVVAEENEEGSGKSLRQSAASEAEENDDSFSLSDVSSFSAS